MTNSEAKYKALRMLMLGYSGTVICQQIWELSSLDWESIKELVQDCEIEHKEKDVPLEN